MVRKQKKNKKWLYWLLMLVLFVVAAVIVYLVWNAYFRDKDEGQNSGTTVEAVEIEKQEEPQKQEDVDIPNKPKMVVVRIERSIIKNADKRDYLKGVRCRWFSID